ncbi:MAG TPA: hypothetical protein VFD37_03655, partial [Solirubrobacterales bacterium]|nr:hypothetical protein [Solirubrobacterales bacterium]
MAARRLLIVMLILLAISVAAAALAPEPADRDSDQSAAQTELPEGAGWGDESDADGGASDGGDAGDGGAEGRLTRTVAVGDTVQRVRVARGVHLTLLMRGDEAAEVEIPGLGLIEWMDPAAPARFELLLDRPGRYEVIADGERVVAELLVAADVAGGAAHRLEGGGAAGSIHSISPK